MPADNIRPELSVHTQPNPIINETANMFNETVLSAIITNNPLNHALHSKINDLNSSYAPCHHMAYNNTDMNYENVASKIRAGVYKPDWKKLSNYTNFMEDPRELMRHLYSHVEEHHGTRFIQYLNAKWKTLNRDEVLDIKRKVESILAQPGLWAQPEYQCAITEAKMTNEDYNDAIRKRDEEIAKQANQIQIFKEQNKNMRADIIRLNQVIISKDNELRNMEISKTNTIKQILETVLPLQNT